MMHHTRVGQKALDTGHWHLAILRDEGDLFVFEMGFRRTLKTRWKISLSCRCLSLFFCYPGVRVARHVVARNTSGSFLDLVAHDNNTIINVLCAFPIFYAVLGGLQAASSPKSAIDVQGTSRIRYNNKHGRQVQYCNIVCLMLTDAGWIIFQDLCLGRSTILFSLPSNLTPHLLLPRCIYPRLKYSTPYSTSLLVQLQHYCLLRAIH